MSNSSKTMAQQPTKKLRISIFSIQTKTTLLIILLGLLTIINFWFVSHSNSLLRVNASVIEVARRNEVISQKFGFIANTVFSGDEEARKELQNAITEHDFNINLLDQGGETILADKKITIPPTTDEVQTKLTEVKTLWQTYRENLLTIVNQQALVTQIDSTIDNQGKVSYNVRKAPNKMRRDAMTFIQDNTLNLFIQNTELSDFYLERFFAYQAQANVKFVILFICYTLLLIVAYYQLVKSFVRPVKNIANATALLANGDLSIKINTRRNDEIGTLAKDINKLTESLKATSDFAQAIGEYKFDMSFDVKNEHDKLGQALLGMRDNLKRVDEESNRRRWTNEGVTLFNDILRTNFDEFSEFAYQIIYNLVQYLDMNQGAFFSLTAHRRNQEKLLKLDAAYAFDRRRFEEKTISLEEGLLAQVVIEKDIIYLTEIPQDYIEITSGLGDASPSVLLIIPLISENEVYGAIELASFRKLDEHEIKFATRIADMVASAIATVRMNENTKKLLEDAKQYAQQMRSQEEEMRQNMEELAATQETLEKREKEKTEALEKLKAEYDSRIDEIYQKETILRDQKARIQEALDTANDKNTQIERQQEELRVTLEKFKNKENLLNNTIKAKDKEIEDLKKLIEDLKKPKTD